MDPNLYIINYTIWLNIQILMGGSKLYMVKYTVNDRHCTQVRNSVHPPKFHFFQYF